MLNDIQVAYGKNIIETLSEGMYDNPLFLFREYVQNSADAIDVAEKKGILPIGTGMINVIIDPNDRFISFEDNGVGIKKNDVVSVLLYIGGSSKNRMENKGFRGIGRLGGLGYCKTVKFETSVMGEKEKTILCWDAEKLHQILIDNENSSDASKLILEITNVYTEPCNEKEHYFKVSLIDVHNNSDELLEVDEVKKYLSMVAPIKFDFQKFRFVEKIENFLKENNIPKPCQYQLYVNGEEISKGYETPLKIDGGGEIEILDVECKLLVSNNKIIGWYWLGISRFEGVLSSKCWQRCIRLRKENIQIGEADCLSNHPRRGIVLWKEDRGNNYFFGEIHVLDKNLIPNSRRDYFIQDDACRNFEKTLSEEFVNLHTLYHRASELRSNIKKCEKAKQAKQDFSTKDRAGAFIDEKERKEAQKNVEKLEKEAKTAQKKLEEISTVPNINPIRKIYNEYIDNIKDYTVEDELQVIHASPKDGYLKDNVSPNTFKVLQKVFDVLQKGLTQDQFKFLKEAIIKKFVDYES